MAEQEQWITSGRLPVDFSQDEAFLSGPVVYEPGRCKFRFVGWQNNPRAKGKGVVAGFLILDGPGDKHANKNRMLRKTFNMENTSSRAYFKGLCLKLAGEAAFVKGEPDFSVLAGIEFEADLFERDTTFEDRKTGQVRSGKNYDIDASTIQVTQKAATAGTGAGFRPAS